MFGEISDLNGLLVIIAEIVHVWKSDVRKIAKL